MTSRSTSRITAQDFYDFKKCPHRVYLNRYGREEERLPQSAFLNLLFENGLSHERDVIKGLAFETPTGTTLGERAESTLKLLRRGADRIFHGVLLLASESGIPDLLEKVTGSSLLGDFFYVPVDIKAGSGYKDREKQLLREDYGMQLYHYGALLQSIQGVFPPEAAILNRDKDRIPYRLDLFKGAYEHALPEIRALVTGVQSDEPAYSSSACGACQWWGCCEKVLDAKKDVTLLPDVGRSRKAILSTVGIRSIPDIPNLDFSKIKLKGIGRKTVDSMVRAANSVLSNRLQVLGRALIPDPPRKIYLDFEDDPTQDLIYLCGMWVEPPLNQLNYHGLFCADDSGEEKIWTEFQKICVAVASDDYAVFHYSSYESAKLNSLERKYGTQEKDAVTIFRNRMVDLCPIVKETVVLPTRSYGLKAVAPFAGIKYSAKDAGGAQSIVWFQEYQQDQNREDLLKTLLTYNREDCVAMKYVEGWLRTLAPS
ncbi:MAG: TM0106 family RecB-like putative nuclease [Candidatus Acidiferrales bacterium]